jgi:cell division protein FtsX
MPANTKLTKQSEAILYKLKQEVKRHILTADEVSQLREGLEWMDALKRFGLMAGTIRRFVVGLAIFLTSMVSILSYSPWLRKLLRIE